MRVDCEALRNEHSGKLIDDLRLLGVEPIITSYVVRVVYEGKVGVGMAIIERFKQEPDHGIVADYEKHDEEARKKAEREKRGKR